MITRRFLFWWLVLSLQVLFIIGGVYFDMHLFFWQNDITYISSVLLIIYLLTSLFIGIENIFGNRSKDIYWFISENCMTLGLIGTVIGFIIMIGPALANIDPTIIDTVRTAIVYMSTGMSTALLTTLAGLVVGLFLKIQLVVLDYEA